MASASFEFDDFVLRRNLRDLDGKVEHAITAAVHRAAAKGEAYLKVDAPWTDRTGAARSGLHTNASSGGGKHTIVFSHTVHYGIWLEVKNSGRYEVIMPTVMKTGKELMNDFKGIFGRMR